MKTMPLLTWGGIGSFIGFVLAVSLYGGNEGLVYLIYVGFIGGLILGTKYPLKARASAVSFPLGFFSTTALAILWLNKDYSTTDIYIIIATAMVILFLTGIEGLLDMFLVPITYLGGFVLAMLTFRGYQSLQGTEGAIMGLFMQGVMGSILGFFAVLSRWAFSMAKRLPMR